MPARRRGPARAGSLTSRAVTAVVVVLLASCAFPSWLLYHFLDGPGLGRWVGALATLGAAAWVGLRCFGRLRTWLLTAIPFTVVGWVCIATAPVVEGDGDDLMYLIGRLGLLMGAWPVQAFVTAGAVVVVVHPACRAWGEWRVERKAAAEAPAAPPRLQARGVRDRVLLSWRRPREGTEFATAWTYAAAGQWHPGLPARPPADAGVVVVHRAAEDPGRSGLAVLVDGRRRVALRPGEARMVVTPAGPHVVSTAPHGTSDVAELDVAVPANGWVHVQVRRGRTPLPLDDAGSGASGSGRSR